MAIAPAFAAPSGGAIEGSDPFGSLTPTLSLGVAALAELGGI